MLSYTTVIMKKGQRKWYTSAENPYLWYVNANKIREIMEGRRRQLCSSSDMRGSKYLLSWSCQATWEAGQGDVQISSYQEEISAVRDATSGCGLRCSHSSYSTFFTKVKVTFYFFFQRSFSLNGTNISL